MYLPDNMVVYGVKINTPHYLAKLEELSPGDSTFTVIVSQLDSLSTIHYTLRVCDPQCGVFFIPNLQLSNPLKFLLLYMYVSAKFLFFVEKMCDFWHRVYFSVCNFQVYATCEFSVAPVHNPYHHSEEVCYYANI